MSSSRLVSALIRSLSTAWTPNHQGPVWAPWAWTILINTLIGLALSVIKPGRAVGLVSNLIVSNAIGLSIHGLFWLFGRTLKLEMFSLPPWVRFLYVLGVVLSGSWIGFALAMLLQHRDLAVVGRILQSASGGLLTLPLLWATLMVVTLAAVNRLRSRQLDGERLRSERARADREAMAARLALLNAQIEPHFLYNTLAHVRALTGRDAQAAQRMIDSLIEYLRASSRNMALSRVALAEEVDSVRGYLAVMQQRLGTRLSVSWQMPPEAGALPIPPAALQTLVENAIKHGIEPSAEGGEIRIEAHDLPAGWAVDVVNTGVAFNATPGSESASGASAAGRGGTGLANLRERLRLSLGPDATLTLDSLPGATRARILLPRSTIQAADKDITT